MPRSRHPAGALSTMPYSATIRRLASRWSGAGPLLPAFALLAMGSPLEIDQIAGAAGVGSDAIERSLASRASARRFADGQPTRGIVTLEELDDHATLLYETIWHATGATS